MSLRDREPKIARVGRRAKIDEILDELEPEDREVLEGWLVDLRYVPERIAHELRDEGFDISGSAIARYRHEVLKIGDRKR